MSYLVLARKYRPKSFAELCGQENLTATLRGAIEEGRIGHAYLFSGPRGTGKTTTARILAKALNCEQGPATEPCNRCERCLAADNGSEVDIVEIDAASNRRIENIRELRDSVGYRPLRARFKIFIVDEVHMLTTEAVNAFLKTLEEPPPHVKFFFATTEPEKLLPTFLSRCQVIRLSLIPEARIAERVEQVFALEGIRAGPGVALEIARRSRGGLRDALSLAEQLLSLVGAEPVIEDLDRLSGERGADAIEALLDQVESGARADVVRSFAALSGSETELAASLLEHVRGSLVVHLCGADTPLVEGEPALRARMAARAARLGIERAELWLEELLHARERLETFKGAHARLVLESTLLDLCRQESTIPLAELEQRLLALERRLEGSGGPSGPAHTGNAAPRRPPANDHVLQPQPRPEMRPPPPSDESRSPAPPRPAARPALAPAASAAPVATGSVSSTSSAPPRAAPARAEPADAKGARGASGARGAESTPRPVPARDLETWSRFLDELGAHAASLAEVLRLRGRLAEIGGGRARIKLSQLRAEDRALLDGPRAAKTCGAVLARIHGEPIEVVLEETGAATRAPKDPFTGHVSELFGGRFEDEG